MSDAINGRAIVPVTLRSGETIEVVVREVTVGDLRAYLARLPDAGTVLDEGLIEHLRLVDLPLFCSLSGKEVDQLRPSQLRQIAQVVRDLNADFFGLLERTRPAAMLEHAKSNAAPSPTSTTPA